MKQGTRRKAESMQAAPTLFLTSKSPVKDQDPLEIVNDLLFAALKKRAKVNADTAAGGSYEKKSYISCG